MTIGEFRILIEDRKITDDFEIDVVGEHSGSFGTVEKVKCRTTDTPAGEYKEVVLFIDA